MDISSYVVISLLLGFIPPALWLWFWIREDLHPEPRKEIMIVFLAGMASVVFAVLFEKSIYSLNSRVREIWQYSSFSFQFINIIGFAFVEELVKVGAAYWTALKSKFFDEPVDAMVYMVTAALGFAALENVFFIGESLKSGVEQSIIVSAFRFINASLLHISASAIIGAGLAMSFFHKERRVKELLGGILIATFLHVLYNFFIINSTWSAASQAWLVGIVITGGFVSLILFERARREMI